MPACSVPAENALELLAVGRRTFGVNAGEERAARREQFAAFGVQLEKPRIGGDPHAVGTVRIALPIKGTTGAAADPAGRRAFRSDRSAGACSAGGVGACEWRMQGRDRLAHRGWAVVGLFAGPGGLAEGFARCRRADGAVPFRIVLSVEKDPAAWETLRLRNFLRRLDHLPPSYLAWVADPRSGQGWEERHPTPWREATEETLRRKLGAPGVFEALAPRPDALRERHHGDTVLIGGPPC